MSYIGNTPTLGHFPTDTFTSVGGSTYTLSQSPSTTGAIEVSVQGVTQAVSAYSLSGPTLTLAGVVSGDIVFVRHLGETLLVPVPGDDTVTTIKIVDDAVTTAKILNDAIDGTKIADNAIDSEHYTDLSIDTAHIANDQITLAKMEGATDGQIITYDASGDPVRVGPGTDGQVLTSTGAGSPPAFEAAASTPSGSTTVSGSVELLTNAEAITGSDTTRAMTATAMRAALVDGNDTVLGKFNLKDYGLVTVAKGNLGATPAFDISTGNHQTGTNNQTITSSTFTNPTASDELCSFVLSLTNGGAFSIVWPTSVDWEGGTAPTLTTSGLDILVFMTYDGGTIWHGMLASLASA